MKIIEKQSPITFDTLPLPSSPFALSVDALARRIRRGTSVHPFDFGAVHLRSGRTEMYDSQFNPRNLLYLFLINNLNKFIRRSYALKQSRFS